LKYAYTEIYTKNIFNKAQYCRLIKTVAMSSVKYYFQK